MPSLSTLSLSFVFHTRKALVGFFIFLFKSLRRLGGEVIRTGELGHGHKDWRALQDWEIHVPKLPISHQRDVAAVPNPGTGVEELP